MRDPQKTFTRINIAGEQDLTIADRKHDRGTVFIGNTKVVSASPMWLVFALFAFDIDRVAPVSFDKIQEFVDGFDIGDTVRHGSTS